MNNKIPL